jgi:hypothetical protein
MDYTILKIQPFSERIDGLEPHHQDDLVFLVSEHSPAHQRDRLKILYYWRGSTNYRTDAAMQMWVTVKNELWELLYYHSDRTINEWKHCPARTEKKRDAQLDPATPKITLAWSGDGWLSSEIGGWVRLGTLSRWGGLIGGWALKDHKWATLDRNGRHTPARQKKTWKKSTIVWVTYLTVSTSVSSPSPSTFNLPILSSFASRSRSPI